MGTLDSVIKADVDVTLKVDTLVEAGKDAEDGSDDPLEWYWHPFRGFVLLASLYGFLFGLDMMGNAFKAISGKSVGSFFGGIGNPIAGLMVGILATIFLQSSSTTTSIVVCESNKGRESSLTLIAKCRHEFSQKG